LGTTDQEHQNQFAALPLHIQCINHSCSFFLPEKDSLFSLGKQQLHFSFPERNMILFPAKRPRTPELA